ncbi:tetratricopeptide repeat protein [Vibrio cholerae]|nr:tetratricopeptide repeat protein [Vibrio cholerae]EKF9234443.1 tetratricopeptide repeat protein [Vibrio cholerae]HCJ6893378.1 tetratricopeptide repeat protein [Vibrio cholerae]
MYILLSSTEQAYRVGVRLQRASADAAQVSVTFSGTTVPKLGERAAQQLGYAQKAAEAAHVSLSPLDWHHKLLGQLTLTPICGDALVFEAGSSSAGLGYALALHVAFRRKLGKHLPATMPVVFATGAVESSGVVEKIGHLATKLQGAFHCAQSHHAGEPFVVYYPKANEADVSDEHHAQALQLGGRLVAVSRLGEALLDLLGDTYDGDLDSRLEPFKGLASFDYADHFIFFGREDALSRLQQDYHNTTGLLVVTGVSGAGKSSLIKAGLLPQLVQATPSLRYSITQPKLHDSLAALLQYLLDSDYPDSPVAANALLSQDKEAEAVFIAHANQQPAIFWYIDQFEEAANLFPEALEGSQFTALLHRLASAIRSLSIVISVRSEYLSSIGVAPNESPVSQSIPPMGFKAIIENQAKAFGLHYEDGLVARLVEDSTAIQHALPALEYMLRQMNELRKQTSESKTLTHAQYDALGGLKGGITQQLEGILHAHERQSDEFFEYAIGLNEAGQLYARSMIKEQIPQPLQPLIHALIDKQLLIGFQTEHGTRLRLAHDSLLQTTWPRLKAWLEPENGTSRKGYLHWLEHNWGDFQAWRALKEMEQAKAYLLTRNNLTEGNVHLTAANLIQRQDVRDYISASQANQQEQARQETQKQRRRVGIFFSIAFIALLAAGWAYIKQKEAIEERNRAQALIESIRQSVQYLSFDLKEVLTAYAPIVERAKLTHQVNELNQALQMHSYDDLSANDLRNYATSLLEKATVMRLNDTLDASQALALVQEALLIFQQLSKLEPYNTNWLRGLWASYNALGDISLAQGEFPEALVHYQWGFAVIKSMSNVSPSDTKLQHDLSQSYRNFGDIYLAQGQYPEALEQYNLVLEIRKRLASFEPSNIQWQRDLWLTYQMLGQIYLAQGKLYEASEQYQLGLTIAEHLVAINPSHIEWQSDLSISYNNVGDIYRMTNKLPEALAQYQLGLAIVERLVAFDPNHIERQQELSHIHNNLGDIYRAQGQLPESLTQYQLGLNIRERLAALNPNDAQLQRYLAISQLSIGDIYHAQGQLPGALAHYQLGLANFEQLAALDPSNTPWQRDLAISHGKLGDIYQAQGQLPEALAHYQMALTNFEKLAALEPSNTTWQHDLAISHSELGNIYQAQGQLPEASEQYQLAVARAQHLVATDPNYTQLQLRFAISHSQLGNIYQAQGQLPEALVQYQSGLTIVERLAELDPSQTEWQRALSISYDNLGAIYRAQGQLPEALAQYQLGLTIRERLAALDPSHTEWQRDLSVSYEQLGAIYRAQGQLAEALVQYQLGLKITERLAALDPSHNQWQRDLLVYHFKIGNVYQVLDDSELALASFNAALAVNKRLLALNPDNAEWQRDGEIIQRRLQAVHGVAE